MNTARSEWRRSWPYPVIGMLGIGGSVTFAYGSGIFLGPMTAEFGWTRAQFSSAFALQMLVGLVTMPLVGRLVDRFGARPLALIGCIASAIGLAQLGFVNTGSRTVWLASCLAQSLLTAFAAPPVWMTPVVARFDRSRGLALAVGLAGIGLGMAVWPLLAAFAIGAAGWRWAFVMLALYWPLVMMPLTAIAFRPAQAGRDRAAAPVAGVRYLPMLFSRGFLSIAGAGGLFAVVSFGLTLHLVPILRGGGLGLAAAAGIAGLTGMASIAGRLGTGLLLDRLPAHVIGTGVFLVPALVCALLWHGGTGPAVAAALLLGLAAGAETDIVIYLASRTFDGAGFATVYGVVTAIFGVCASMGPLLAGALFDRTGSYAAFFLLAPPIVAVAALLLWLVPSRPGGLPGNARDHGVVPTISAGGA